MKSTNEYLTLLRIPMPVNMVLSVWGFSAVLPVASKQKIAMWIFVLKPPLLLLTLARIKFELEALLGSRVDLVRLRDRMDEYLKRNIEKEALYV